MVGKDDVEALDESMIEDMGKGYRFRPLMQGVIIGLIIFVTAFVLYITGMFDFNVQGHLSITTLTFCWILAFLFPLIVKTRSHRVHQISMGIYWASILSLIGVILLLIIDASVIQPTSIALLIAFLVGVGAQLFQHLNPELIQRNALTYFSVFCCSAIFFICVWIYLDSLLAGWGIWLSIIFSAIFAYALLPEHPA
ncbi:MAG: hypothetical protein ACTSQI_00595 [Candidatus Helarchaeota archaeon]